MKKVLLTGGLGFIGGRILKRLIDKEVTVYLLVRPGKDIPKKYQNKKILPIFIDLSDSELIWEKIDPIDFEILFHVAAIRGGRKFSEAAYSRVNIDATETLAKIAIKKNAKMIFCSSVGVFGAIPRCLPAKEDCSRQTDNYYHYTKIEAEHQLGLLKEQGLRYVVLRPSITYGAGDNGFPYGLIRLIDKGRLFLSPDTVRIHFTDLNVLAEAFEKAALKNLQNGSAYIIADKEPVEIKVLADWIAKVLNKSPGYRVLPSFIFRICEFLAATIFKNDLWTSRFQLLSRSWYYDVSKAEKDLDLNLTHTFVGFRETIAWYNSLK